MLLHIYADAARLDDPTYRSCLREHAGVVSAADPDFSQHGFDHSMAALETVLFERVHRGMVTNPLGKNRYIRDETHWRDRLPRRGHLNTRQVYKINELWTRLQEYLDPAQRNLLYLTGIIRKATGKLDSGFSALTSSEAENLIDALKDRLSYAIANPQSEIPLEEAPF